MTDEDLDVWGTAPPEVRPAPRERRWRRVPVRWLVIAVAAVLLGVWINSYAQLREERDRALDELGAARGEAGRAAQLLNLSRLESEFRSFDLLMLPEVAGMTASLGVVNVINADGDPRTWLLLRARGAEPGNRYRLDVAPCPTDDEPETDFPPFSTRNTAAADGQLEMAAQNLDAPTDADAVVVVLRDQRGEPLVGILGPLVLPRRIVTGAAATTLC